MTGYPFPPDRATAAGEGRPSLKRKRRTSLTLQALIVAFAAGCGGPTSPIVGKTPAELEAMLRSPDAMVQTQGALGLSKLGPAAKDAVPSLIEALKSPSLAVRQNAALALGSIGPDAKAAVPALTATLKDTDWAVRRHAAVALGRLGAEAKAAVPDLKRLAKDKNSLVNKAAQEALKQIGPG